MKWTPSPPEISRDAQTRLRLLEAAGQVFAEHGFKSATIREIVRRAGANVAAVNYHFQDKTNLYRQVLRHWSDISLKKYPPNLGVSESDSAERKLAAFVRSFVLRVLDQGRPSWFGKLMSREMIEPTPALHQQIDEVFKPIHDQLLRILRELVGPGASGIDVDRAACSVIGQCCFFHHSRPVVEKLFPNLGYKPDDIETLAAHITAFCLAGLKSMRRVSQAGGKKVKGGNTIRHE